MSELPPFRGLANTSGDNNCYMNAAVQCLLNEYSAFIAPVRDEARDHVDLVSTKLSSKSHLQPAPLAQSLCRLEKEMREDKANAAELRRIATFDARPIATALSVHRELYKRGMMNDVAEAMSHLLEAVHAELFEGRGTETAKSLGWQTVDHGSKDSAFNIDSEGDFTVGDLLHSTKALHSAAPSETTDEDVHHGVDSEEEEEDHHHLLHDDDHMMGMRQSSRLHEIVRKSSASREEADVKENPLYTCSHARHTSEACKLHKAISLELSLDWECSYADCKSKKKKKGQPQHLLEARGYSDWIFACPAFPLAYEEKTEVTGGSSPYVLREPDADKDPGLSFAHWLRQYAFDVAPKGCDYCDRTSSVNVHLTRMPEKLFLLHLNWHVSKPVKKAVEYLLRNVVENVIDLNELFGLSKTAPLAVAKVTGLIIYKGLHYTAVVEDEVTGHFWFLNDAVVKKVAVSWQELIDWIVINSWIPTLFVSRVLRAEDRVDLPVAAERPKATLNLVTSVRRRATEPVKARDANQPTLVEAFGARSLPSRVASVEGDLRKLMDVCACSRNLAAHVLQHENLDVNAAIQYIVDHPDITPPSDAEDVLMRKLQTTTSRTFASESRRPLEVLEPANKGPLSGCLFYVHLLGKRAQDVRKILRSLGATVAAPKSTTSKLKDSPPRSKQFCVTSTSDLHRSIESHRAQFPRDPSCDSLHIPTWFREFIFAGDNVIQDVCFDNPERKFTPASLGQHKINCREYQRELKSKISLTKAIASSRNMGPIVPRAAGVKRPRDDDNDVHEISE